MHVTLIRPDIGRLEEGAYRERGCMEPLELAMIAAATPEGHQVKLYDDRIEDIPYDAKTDLVGISVEVYTARRSFEIAQQYRRRGVPVVLGGFHPTLAPDECLEFADAIVVGDGEEAWPRVVADAGNGCLQRVYRGAAGAFRNPGLIPRREIYARKSYLPILLTQFSRGCPYPCDFCAISAFFERRHAVRDAEDVVREIETSGARYVFFVDDNFIANRRAAKRLMRALVPLGIRWISQASIDMADDPELMDLMEASGCLGTVTGFESVDPAALKTMGKVPNLRAKGWDRYERQIEITRRHHLQIWAAFTIGHDHETLASIEESYEFARTNRFAFAAFNILMPYPGTPLYTRLAEENRLLWDGKWWLHPDYRFNSAAFVPKMMSANELTQAVWELRRKWTTLGSIFGRLWDPKTHLSSVRRAGMYLHYNWVHARDARAKQGMIFGKEGATSLPFPA